MSQSLKHHEQPECTRSYLPHQLSSRPLVIVLIIWLNRHNLPITIGMQESEKPSQFFQRQARLLLLFARLHRSIASSKLVQLHGKESHIDRVLDDNAGHVGFFLLADTEDATEGLLLNRVVPLDVSQQNSQDTRNISNRSNGLNDSESPHYSEWR